MSLDRREVMDKFNVEIDNEKLPIERRVRDVGRRANTGDCGCDGRRRNGRGTMRMGSRKAERALFCCSCLWGGMRLYDRGESR